MSSEGGRYWSPEGANFRDHFCRYAKRMGGEEEEEEMCGVKEASLVLHRKRDVGTGGEGMGTLCRIGNSRIMSFLKT